MSRKKLLDRSSQTRPVNLGLAVLTEGGLARRVEIDVEAGRERVSIEVRDDARGGADPTRGSGLRGLAHRVAALDGRFEAISPAGAGTKVRTVIACA
jgi:signal transduction histidine kinase